MLLMALDGQLSRGECALLATALVAYIAMQVILSRRSPEPRDDTIVTGKPAINILLIVIGFGLLVLGARWLVQAAVDIAQLLGMTQLVIGLTIVAAGTSMPELATSVIAGIRGQRDIAVGNIIGSNIFNILAVLGISGILAPGGIPVSNAALTMDIPIMVAVAVLCLPIFSTYTITRWQGLLFLAYYCLYTGYLILDSADHEGLSEYRVLMVTVVVPLTVVTVIVFSLRSWYVRRRT
jgi:cation:H+ antiporter